MRTNQCLGNYTNVIAMSKEYSIERVNEDREFIPVIQMPGKTTENLRY